MNTTTQLADMLMEQHVLYLQRDALITRAIDHALQREDWSLQEVIGRGRLEFYSPNDCVFLFDGVPLLEIMGVQLVKRNGETVHIIAPTPHKQLYEDPIDGTA